MCSGEILGLKIEDWIILFVTCVIISCKPKISNNTHIHIYLREMCSFVQGHLPHCNQFLAREHAKNVKAADCHISLLSEMATQAGDIRRAHSGQPHVPEPLLCLQKFQKEQVSKAILLLSLDACSTSHSSIPSML